jgi:hypothetical protein
MTDARKLILDGSPGDDTFDTSPKSEAEAIHQLKVETTLAAMAAALRNTRHSLTLEQLAMIKDAKPVFEAELPEIDGIRHGVFLFSVSGTIDGKAVHRHLLAGHAIQVSARNQVEAGKLAAAGLSDTITHALAYAYREAHEFAHDEPGLPVTPVKNAGISIDGGGTKVH